MMIVDVHIPLDVDVLNAPMDGGVLSAVEQGRADVGLRHRSEMVVARKGGTRPLHGLATVPRVYLM